MSVETLPQQDIYAQPVESEGLYGAEVDLFRDVEEANNYLAYAVYRLVDPPEGSYVREKAGLLPGEVSDTVTNLRNAGIHAQSERVYRDWTEQRSEQVEYDKFVLDFADDAGGQYHVETARTRDPDSDIGKALDNLTFCDISYTTNAEKEWIEPFTERIICLESSAQEQKDGLRDFEYVDPTTVTEISHNTDADLQPVQEDERKQQEERFLKLTSHLRAALESRVATVAPEKMEALTQEQKKTRVARFLGKIGIGN